MYEWDDAQAFWDIPVFTEHQDWRANRIDAKIIDRKKRQVVVLEISCPWIESKSEQEEEKTLKYSPLRWEHKQLYPGYEIHQVNIIIDVFTRKVGNLQAYVNLNFVNKILHDIK